MAMIEYNKDDSEGRVPLNEGEFLFQINEVRDTPATETERGSMIVILEVVDGPDVKGRVTSRYFQLPSGADKNETAKDGRSMFGVLLSFIEDIVDACGVKWGAKGFDSAELMGKQVYGTVKHEMYKDKPTERIDNWRTA